jgi:hypothetical protein
MRTRRFELIALAQLLLSGWAVMFGSCVLIEHAQAQPGYVPPPTPLPPRQHDLGQQTGAQPVFARRVVGITIC